MKVLCVFTVTENPSKEDNTLLAGLYKPRYIDWEDRYARRKFAYDADRWLSRGKNHAVMTKAVEDKV